PNSKESAMAKNWPHSHLCNGKLIGFSVKKFGNCPTYFVCFRSFDGRRLKRDTNFSRMAQAIEAAKIILDREFSSPTVQDDKVTWDEAVKRLTARLATAGIRQTTAGYYLKLIRLVRKKYDVGGECGPADITPGMAASFRDTMMSTPGRRKKLPSAHYVAGVIVGLSALWEKWFMEDLKIL